MLFNAHRLSIVFWSGCADGSNCEKICAESELEVLLTQGWRVAAVLPSGKIVVSNEAKLR